ncbi:carbon-nitrogen hydrolase [Coniochaeta ligniaria NRRL 30616]|uniref:Carbon-nitrogen hydrolase n=1 Tax=Coniochaeta ligniaria NRRL 30616 TaxID=1408157 RepID=A0A1J7J5Z3_9PEZI|nr:carbon-nitrogen hydrolase [Coniochaeta ligniaria NRRL 30616]
MAPIYKIGLIQLQPIPVNPAANFALAEKNIRAAAAQGCHLAVLPEYHLTSWVPEDPTFISSSQESVTYLAKYQALAKDLNINIVPGTICEVHPSSSPKDADPSTTLPGNPPIEVRNMTYFIAAGTGTILGTYQKKNLWHPERPHLTAGALEPHSAFEVPTLPEINPGKTVKVGLLVCWDLAFPEAFRALVRQGADVIVIPSYWYMSDVDGNAHRFNPECERLFIQNALVARAFENTAAVVYCNAGGLSQVAVPIVGGLGAFGTAKETEERGDEALRVVEVDMEVLRVAEDNYKVREDMAKEGWHYGYGG